MSSKPLTTALWRAESPSLSLKNEMKQEQDCVSDKYSLKMLYVPERSHRSYRPQQGALQRRGIRLFPRKGKGYNLHYPVREKLQ